MDCYIAYPGGYAQWRQAYPEEGMGAHLFSMAKYNLVCKALTAYTKAYATAKGSSLKLPLCGCYAWPARPWEHRQPGGMHVPGGSHGKPLHLYTVHLVHNCIGKALTAYTVAFATAYATAKGSSLELPLCRLRGTSPAVGTQTDNREGCMCLRFPQKALHLNPHNIHIL